MNDNPRQLLTAWNAANARARAQYRSLCESCRYRKRAEGQTTCSRCRKRDLT